MLFPDSIVILDFSEFIYEDVDTLLRVVGNHFAYYNGLPFKTVLFKVFILNSHCFAQ